VLARKDLELLVKTADRTHLVGEVPMVHRKDSPAEKMLSFADWYLALRVHQRQTAAAGSDQKPMAQQADQRPELMTRVARRSR